MSVRCVCASSRDSLVPRVPSSFSERSLSSPSLTALATLDAARVSSRAAVRAQTAATLAKLKSMWVSGEVGPDTPVWTEGMPERTRVRDVPSLLGCLPGASLASPRAALLSDDLRWEPGAPPPRRRRRRRRGRVPARARAGSAPRAQGDAARLRGAARRRGQPDFAAAPADGRQAARMRRDEDEAARETALAEAEAEARDLVQELRALVVEARARSERGGGRRTASAGGDARATSIFFETETHTETARRRRRTTPPASRRRGDGAPPRRRRLRRRRAIRRAGGRAGAARLCRRAEGWAAAETRFENARRRGRGYARGAYAFDLCGKRLWVSADGAGERLLVRARGGSLDLEAWLRRNRFWERARGSGRAARGTRDAEPTEATRG